jgi:hypothetical protein
LDLDLTDSATDALVMMIENRFRHLPVVGGDASHWRSMFDASLEIDESSEMQSSEMQSSATPAPKRNVPVIKAAKSAPMVSSVPSIPGNIPSTLEFQNGVEEDFDDPTLNDTLRFDAGSLLSDVKVS